MSFLRRNWQWWATRLTNTPSFLLDPQPFRYNSHLLTLLPQINIISSFQDVCSSVIRKMIPTSLTPKLHSEGLGTRIYRPRPGASCQFPEMLSVPGEAIYQGDVPFLLNVNHKGVQVFLGNFSSTPTSCEEGYIFLDCNQMPMLIMSDRRWHVSAFYKSCKPNRHVVMFKTACRH